MAEAVKKEEVKAEEPKKLGPSCKTKRTIRGQGRADGNLLNFC